MASRYTFDTDLFRKPEQSFKLEVRIAQDAWNRSLPTQILANERLNYISLKLFLRIQNVKWKAELFRNSPGIINVID